MRRQPGASARNSTTLLLSSAPPWRTALLTSSVVRSSTEARRSASSATAKCSSTARRASCGERGPPGSSTRSWRTALARHVPRARKPADSFGPAGTSSSGSPASTLKTLGRARRPLWGSQPQRSRRVAPGEQRDLQEQERVLELRQLRGAALARDVRDELVDRAHRRNVDPLGD